MEYREEGDRLKDTRPCKYTRAELKICLLNTNCCQVEKRTPRSCLEDPNSDVPKECRDLAKTMAECKRSLLDMRTRLRGRRYN